MITGFEDITYDLTDYEKSVIVPEVVAGIRCMEREGKIYVRNESGAITSKVICQKMNERIPAYKMTDARLRKIINYIRREDLITEGYLVASSKGYWVETDVLNVRKYIDSLKQRAGEIMSTATALETKIIKQTQSGSQLELIK